MRATLAQPSPSQSEKLDDIGRAFFAAVDRDGRPAFVLIAAVVVLALIAGLVYWVLRDVRRDRIEQSARDSRHEATMSMLPASGGEGRKWARVAAHLPMSVQHPDGQRFWYEDCKTLSISAGSVAFLSSIPPAPGCPIDFMLDLGEKERLPLRGVVERVEPSNDGATALVAVKLDPSMTTERERVVRWVAHEEQRELALAHRGPVCPVCGRPAEHGAVHSTCAPPANGAGPRRAGA